jgi:hypothetical protein
MRSIVAALGMTAFLTSSVLAADAPAPLPAGKPAGTQKAALESGGVLLVGGLIVIGGIIAAIAATTQGDSTSGTGS